MDSTYLPPIEIVVMVIISIVLFIALCVFEKRISNLEKDQDKIWKQITPLWEKTDQMEENIGQIQGDVYRSNLRVDALEYS